MNSGENEAILKLELGNSQAEHTEIGELLSRLRSKIDLSRLYGIMKNENMELKSKITELEEKNNELDAYARTVSHELKTPLNSILGYHGILQEELGKHCNQRQHDFMNRLGEVAIEMSSMIDEILRFSNTVDEDKTEVVNSDKIISEVLNDNLELIHERNAEIIISKKLHPAIGNANWLKEVWSNFITNALKYGSDPLVIEIGSEKDSGHTKYWIKNNGELLTEEEKRTIFNEFTRFHANPVEGNGLGLSIVSRIIKKLGGNVEVESSEEVGVKFLFTLQSAKLNSINLVNQIAQ